MALKVKTPFLRVTVMIARRKKSARDEQAVLESVTGDNEKSAIEKDLDEREDGEILP